MLTADQIVDVYTTESPYFVLEEERRDPNKDSASVPGETNNVAAERLPQSDDADMPHENPTPLGLQTHENGDDEDDKDRIEGAETAPNVEISPANKREDDHDDVKDSGEKIKDHDHYKDKKRFEGNQYYQYQERLAEENLKRPRNTRGDAEQENWQHHGARYPVLKDKPDSKDSRAYEPAGR